MACCCGSAQSCRCKKVFGVVLVLALSAVAVFAAAQLKRDVDANRDARAALVQDAAQNGNSGK